MVIWLEGAAASFSMESGQPIIFYKYKQIFSGLLRQRNIVRFSKPGGGPDGGGGGSSDGASGGICNECNESVMTIVMSVEHALSIVFYGLK